MHEEFSDDGDSWTRPLIAVVKNGLSILNGRFIAVGLKTGPAVDVVAVVRAHALI